MLINGHRAPKRLKSPTKTTTKLNRKNKKAAVETTKTHQPNNSGHPIAQALNNTFRQGDTQAFMQTLNELINAYGISQLAKQSDIDRVTLWRFIRGERIPRIDTLQKILENLGIKTQFSVEKSGKPLIAYINWKKQKEAERANSQSTDHSGTSGSPPPRKTTKRIGKPKGGQPKTKGLTKP